MLLNTANTRKLYKTNNNLRCTRKRALLFTRKSVDKLKPGSGHTKVRVYDKKIVLPEQMMSDRNLNFIPYAIIYSLSSTVYLQSFLMEIQYEVIST